MVEKMKPSVPEPMAGEIPAGKLVAGSEMAREMPAGKLMAGPEMTGDMRCCEPRRGEAARSAKMRAATAEMARSAKVRAATGAELASAAKVRPATAKVRRGDSHRRIAKRKSRNNRQHCPAHHLAPVSD